MDIDQEDGTDDNNVIMEENTGEKKDTDSDNSNKIERKNGKRTTKPVDLQVQINLYGGEMKKSISPKKRKTPSETKKYSKKVKDIDKADQETKKSNDKNSTHTGQSRKKKLKGKKAKRIGDKKKFKEINTYLKNRRECKRVEYEDCSEDKKLQTTPTQNHSSNTLR